MNEFDFTTAHAATKTNFQRHPCFFWLYHAIFPVFPSPRLKGKAFHEHDFIITHEGNRLQFVILAFYIAIWLFPLLG
jgi:hypothetical protein